MLNKAESFFLYPPACLILHLVNAVNRRYSWLILVEVNLADEVWLK